MSASSEKVREADRGPEMDDPKHGTDASPGEPPHGRDTRVCEAARSGDRALVERLLADGCSVHQRGEQHWTPLHFAAGKGDLALVELLVAKGADIAARGHDRRTPLMVAKAACRDAVSHFLAEREQAQGIWEPPTLANPYCKAYRLGELRRFHAWSEKRENWKVSPYWTDELKTLFDGPLSDEDAVFVHHDFTVTRWMWHGEHLIFDDLTDEWRRFCGDVLGFRLPEDLR